MFIHQDLAVKERETHKVLIQELKKTGCTRGDRSDYNQRKNCKKEEKQRLADISSSCSCHFTELKCLYTNANSLLGKLEELRCKVNNNKYHIIAITETWTKNDITDAELNITSYCLYKKDRLGTSRMCIYTLHDL